MRRVLLLVLGLAAALAAGCGQSNPELIPQANAEALQQTADNIQAACEAEDRSEARAQVRLARREVDALPRGVDGELKQNLEAWIEHVEDRISRDCRAEETPTPSPDETATPDETAAPTETATAEPTETATQAPTEAPTEQPTEEPTVPPEPTTEGNGGTEFEDGQE